MKIKKWEELPSEMQNDEVRVYYDVLLKKKTSLVYKRLFDIVVSFMLLVLFSPLFLLIAIAIKVDSPGPVFFRQQRVTQYGKKFRIFKFRTMVFGADKMGGQVTVKDDKRVTRVGKFIRKYRLDETCQLLDVLRGTMTFVGTRPEVSKYVEKYTPEMLATLLLPAGVTSLASIYYKDEAFLLEQSQDIDEIYVNKILKEKMYYNLKEIKEYRFTNDIKTMLLTVLAVFGREK